MMYLQWLVHGKPDAPKKVTQRCLAGSPRTLAIRRIPLLQAVPALRTTDESRGLCPRAWPVVLKSASWSSFATTFLHSIGHVVLSHLYSLSNTHPIVPTRPFGESRTLPSPRPWRQSYSRSTTEGIGMEL